MAVEGAIKKNRCPIQQNHRLNGNEKVKKKKKIPAESVIWMMNSFKFCHPLSTVASDGSNGQWLTFIKLVFRKVKQWHELHITTTWKLKNWERDAFFFYQQFTRKREGGVVMCVIADCARHTDRMTKTKGNGHWRVFFFTRWTQTSHLFIVWIRTGTFPLCFSLCAQ